LAAVYFVGFGVFGSAVIFQGFDGVDHFISFVHHASFFCEHSVELVLHLLGVAVLVFVLQLLELQLALLQLGLSFIEQGLQHGVVLILGLVLLQRLDQIVLLTVVNP